MKSISWMFILEVVYTTGDKKNIEWNQGYWRNKQKLLINVGICPNVEIFE